MSAAVPGPIKRIGVLVDEVLFPLEYAIAAEVFGLERPEAPAIRYDFITVGRRRGATARSGPMTVIAEAGLEALPTLDSLLVPGWTRRSVPDDTLVMALRAAQREGVRIASFCSGAFLLAGAGLLDGRSATTHWKYAADFAERFPGVSLSCNSLYVEDGGVYTAAGSAAGIDLSLHLVREDYGPAAANCVARRLVTAPVRSGGQAQFIDIPAPNSAADERLAVLIDVLPQRLGESLSIEQLAGEVYMSRRTFIRKFEAATGSSPGRWISHLRVRRAQTLLEATRLPMGDIALQCGFASVEGLRRQFQQIAGVQPSLYRKRFFNAAGHRPGGLHPRS
jgi:AraC family transcriptional activator FtrA